MIDEMIEHHTKLSLLFTPEKMEPVFVRDEDFRIFKAKLFTVYCEL